MRKFKSILAVTLSAALAVSATLTTVTASAFAEEPEIAEPAPAVQELEPAAAEEEAPAPVEEKAEETEEAQEKPAEDIPAAEEEQEEIPAEPSEMREIPEISADEIKEILGSEEVKNALEEAGLDEDEIDDITDNPNTRIIYITQAEYNEMRRQDALAGFFYPVEAFSMVIESALAIFASPMIFLIPIVGPVLGVCLVAGTIPIAAVSLAAGVGLTVASPVIVLVRYINFELPDNYVVVK